MQNSLAVQSPQQLTHTFTAEGFLFFFIFMQITNIGDMMVISNTTFLLGLRICLLKEAVRNNSYH